MADPIRVLSVGGGWVVNNRHLPSLKRSGLYDIVGIISKDPDRAEQTAQRFEIPHYATRVDFEQDWQNAADAVMIGTVPHVHHTIAARALDAGKHVLTEKPMTLDPAEAGTLKAKAEANRLVLAVVHNFQFSRAAMRFRQDLANGRLGAVKAVYGVQLCNHERKIPAWCDDLPLGLFFDEAPHFYYLFRWLAGGDLEYLSGSVWESAEPDRNTPRLVSAEYRATGGIPVHLHINFESSLTEWHVTIVGEKGTVDIDVWRDIYVFLPNDGVHTAKDIMRTSLLGAGRHLWGVWTGGVRYLTGRHLYGNLEIVNRFARAIHTGDTAGLTGMNPDEGRCVVEMMHEVIERAERH